MPAEQHDGWSLRDFISNHQIKFVLILCHCILDYNQPISLSQKQYPKYGDVTAKFDIAREKTKMRQTNYRFGELNGGHDSVYTKQFSPKRNDDRSIVTKQDKNRLEASHWDHSRSWSQNFRTEQLQKFKGERNDKSFTANKIFGY